MNFRILPISKKIVTNYYKNPLNQIVSIQTRNYYCEEYEKKQKFEKLLKDDLITANILKLNDKEIFFHNQIKKILEQNSKIQMQNEKIILSMTNSQNNTNEMELLKKYITKEQYKI